MQNIDSFSGDNTGSLESFEFIPSTDVYNIPVAISGNITSAITLVNEKKWYTAKATADTLGYKEISQNSENGAFYKKELFAFIPSDLPAIANLFSEMENERFIIKYTDHEGRIKIVGSIEEPLQFKADMNTQTDASGRKGHFITFYGDGTFKSCFYSIV